MDEPDEQSVRGEKEDAQGGAEQALAVVGRVQSSAHFSAMLRVCCQAIST